MAKFSMTDLLNNKSKEEGNKSVFKIRSLNISEIKPDERNFYSVEDVAELKESIQMFGLQQNLVVRENGDSTYSLISGHRRLKALSELVDDGYSEFKMVPCKIESNMSEVTSELQLIFANSTSRELSDYEKTHQALRMKELLTDLKKSGIKLPGRMRTLVAEALNVSSTQIGRMESIDKNLSDEFKKEFKSDSVNISTAYELSGLSKESQQEAYKQYLQNGQISIKDVRRYKKQAATNNSDSVQTSKEAKALKVYVCSACPKNPLNATGYISQVVEEGHIPFNAGMMMYGISGLKAENAIKAASHELINLSDEVWVFGKASGEETASPAMKEISIAKSLNKPVLYKDIGED